MMRGYMLMAVVALLLLPATIGAGCGATVNTPSDVIIEHVKLLNQRKFDEFYDLHAPGALPSSKEAYVQEITQLFPEGSKITDVKIIQEKVEGDQATVTWSSLQKIIGREERTVEVTTSLVRENDRWKIGESTNL